MEVKVRTLNIAEAADFLKINKGTASELAGAGILPGAKIGRAWVFLEQDLERWLRDQINKQQQERTDTKKKSSAVLVTVNRKQRRRPLPKLPELASKVGSS